MNSIIVLLLLSASVASAQSATSKADEGPEIQRSCRVFDGDTARPCTPTEAEWLMDNQLREGPNVITTNPPKKKAKPKPLVKKKCHEASDIGWHLGDPQACQITLPECTKNNCEMLDAKGTQEYDGILCPESEPNCRDRSTELPTMAKPQEGPKTSDITYGVSHWRMTDRDGGPGADRLINSVDCHDLENQVNIHLANKTDVTDCQALTDAMDYFFDPKTHPPGATGEALQLKDNPSKLCDALSPTEKITCLMNAIAPADEKESATIEIRSPEPRHSGASKPIFIAYHSEYTDPDGRKRMIACVEDSYLTWEPIPGTSADSTQWVAWCYPLPKK